MANHHVSQPGAGSDVPSASSPTSSSTSSTPSSDDAFDHGPAADLTGHLAAYTAAFQSRSADRLDRLYEPDALVIPRPGHPLAGADRVAANRHLLDMAESIEARPRHTYVVGDIALLIVDWTIRGRGPDGGDLRLEGVAADVARRGPGGHWRYVIDNPFGTA